MCAHRRGYSATLCILGRQGFHRLPIACDGLQAMLMQCLIRFLRSDGTAVEIFLPALVMLEPRWLLSESVSF